MIERPDYQGVNKNKINTLFDEYLIYGGYPAVVLAQTISEKQELLQELISSYMKKDALESGIKERLKFFELAKILGDLLGNLVNHHELANTLKMASTTVENYIYLMQKTFIVQMLSPFYGNVRKELTKMPKVYFNDNGLRNALLNNFNNLTNRADKGALLENYVHNRLKKLYGQNNVHFWRTADGNEVDFVVKQSDNKGLAYEVKYNDAQFKPNKYKKFTAAYPDIVFGCISKEVGGDFAKEVIRL
jgi:hypothetical protein